MNAPASVIRADHIEYSFWLSFRDDGTMRFTRTKPGVYRGERAMRCSAKLPKSLFTTPTLSATITVDDAGAAAMTVDVRAASDALSLALGVDVDLRVISS